MIEVMPDSCAASAAILLQTLPRLLDRSGLIALVLLVTGQALQSAEVQQCECCSLSEDICKVGGPQKQTSYLSRALYGLQNNQHSCRGHSQLCKALFSEYGTTADIADIIAVLQEISGLAGFDVQDLPPAVQ